MSDEPRTPEQEAHDFYHGTGQLDPRSADKYCWGQNDAKVFRSADEADRWLRGERDAEA